MFNPTGSLSPTNIMLPTLVALLLVATCFDAVASKGKYDRRARRAVAALDLQYVSECGECHLAYPPGALPARSWARIMGGLADHFGDNAVVDAETEANLRDYLVTHAADTGARRGDVTELARRLAHGDVPLRITELPHFTKEHDEIPHRVYSANPDLSLSQCDACHANADRNSYSEHEINIPGFGRWDD